MYLHPRSRTYSGTRLRIERQTVQIDRRPLLSVSTWHPTCHLGMPRSSAAGVHRQMHHMQSIRRRVRTTQGTWSAQEDPQLRSIQLGLEWSPPIIWTHLLDRAVYRTGGSLIGQTHGTGEHSIIHDNQCLWCSAVVRRRRIIPEPEGPRSQACVYLGGDPTNRCRNSRCCGELRSQPPNSESSHPHQSPGLMRTMARLHGSGGSKDGGAEKAAMTQQRCNDEATRCHFVAFADFRIKLNVFDFSADKSEYLVSDVRGSPGTPLSKTLQDVLLLSEEKSHT